MRSHYWQAAFILLAGGLIGVFFIILLRRPLCVESDLPFPESVASAEIVKSGDRAGDAPRYLFGAMGFGALIQILNSDRGLLIFREFTQGFLRFPRWLVRGASGDVIRTAAAFPGPPPASLRPSSASATSSDPSSRRSMPPAA